MLATLFSATVSWCVTWFFIEWLMGWFGRTGGTSSYVWATLVVGGMILLARTDFAENLIKGAAMIEDNPKTDAYVKKIIARHFPPEIVPRDLRVGIIHDSVPNAVAIGRRTLGVTAGLLGRATEEELVGVLGHELGHFNRGDTLRTISAMFAFAPGAASMFILWYAIAISFVILTFGCAFEEEPGEKTAVGYYMSFPYMAMGLAIYWLVNLVLLADSRIGEYRADEFSARTSETARLGLISYLEWMQRQTKKKRYGFVEAILSTHPSPDKRVARLKRIGGEKNGR
ncbi:MAG: M48 family metalloprotease [Bacillota bacterium]